MNSILRNALNTDAINSLRKTRTSEVSTFVKNYNQAQSRALRKEVGIWYKDTNHVLRTMNGQQHKLYASLLQLSRARKTIKTQRQDENKMKKVTFDYDKKRKELMKRRRKQALMDRDRHKTNILTISEEIVEQLSDDTDVESESEQYDSDGNLALTVRNLSSFEKSLQNEEENGEDDANLELNNDSYTIDFENSSKMSSVDDNNVIDAIDELNRHDGVSTTKTELNGLVLTRPKRTSLPSNGIKELPPVFPRRRRHTNRLKSKRFSQFDKIAIPEEAEVLNFTKLENQTENRDISDGVPKILPTINNTKMLHTLHDSSDDANEQRNSNVFINAKENDRAPRKRKVRNLPKLKTSRSDPSEEINTKSSIQAMGGKQYQVTMYKKDSNGNLLEEDEIVDTTVDVAKYFHFSSYRERLNRKKLLEESRDKEIRQRKRVSEFLIRLSREEEKTRQRIKEIAKQNEEARLALLNRADAIKKGPPKYGIRTDTSTPGYVRKYVRPSKDEAFYTRRERKRSSWYLPSIYSLNASLDAPNSLSSSFNSGSTKFKAQQRHIEDMSLCASHLVNINMERYLKKATAQ